MIRYFLLLFLLSTATLNASAQLRDTACTISGVVIDKKGEPISYASVFLSDNGKQVAGTVSDIDGRFSLPVAAADSVAGTHFDLKVSCTGYDPMTIRDIPACQEVNVHCTANTYIQPGIYLKSIFCPVPFFNPREPGASTTFYKEQINHMW